MTATTDVAISLLSSLRPWIELLADYGGSCTLKDPSRTELGIVFSFRVWSSSLDHGGDDAFLRVREAIDLLYRLFAVHTALIQQFPTERCGWTRLRGLDGACVKRALERDAPFEMHVTIASCGLKDVDKLTQLTDTFLTQHPPQSSTHETYVMGVEVLESLLEIVKPTWVEKVSPVTIKCWLQTYPLYRWTKLENEALFTHIASFMDAIETFEVPSVRTRTPLPVRMEIVGTKLAPMWITPSIVDTAVAIASKQRARLHCHKMAIDPRRVAVSRDQLKTLLQALSKDTASGMDIDIEPFTNGTGRTLPMDSEVADMSQFMDDLFKPIATCQNVRSVHITSLFGLFLTPASRDALYHGIIAHMLTRPQPIDLFFPGAEVSSMDAQQFAAQAQAWRTLHPQEKLRVKRLAFVLYDAEHVFANAFIEVIDEVDELIIRNHEDNAPPISIEQVRAILTKFQTLRVLDLTHVHLESMHVLLDSAPRTLEKIGLISLRLDDRDSFHELLVVVGYPDHPLTQHLRHLKINETVEDVQFRLTAAEVDTLAEALYYNNVLETLDVVLEVQEDETKRWQLYETNRRLIPAAPRVRCSSQEKARRVAFISVLMHKDAQDSAPAALDELLVRQVLGFCDPWVERSIGVLIPQVFEEE